jgi:hypothetical protein
VRKFRELLPPIFKTDDRLRWRGSSGELSPQNLPCRYRERSREDCGCGPLNNLNGSCVTLTAEEACDRDSFNVVEASPVCNGVQWSAANVASLASLATWNLQVAERRRRSRDRIPPPTPENQ